MTSTMVDNWFLPVQAFHPWDGYEHVIISPALDFFDRIMPYLPTAVLVGFVMFVSFAIWRENRRKRD